jgi:hypothetical protein
LISRKTPENLHRRCTRFLKNSHQPERQVVACDNLTAARVAAELTPANKFSENFIETEHQARISSAPYCGAWPTRYHPTFLPAFGMIIES